jgi:hypothetical protein
VSRERPINADVPSSDQDEAKPPEGAKAPGAKPAPEKEAAKAAAPAAKPPPRPRRQIPGALKGIAALVLLAIVFIVAAVIGGSGGGSSDEEPTGPAPVTSSADSKESERDAEPASASATELGFPAFATNNTTRIGGSSPAENAAATALAVFPSTTPSQRPAAVALADEADWQGAIAAAVLMAPPLRAPLLLSAGGELPEASSEALDALDPQGGPDSDGAAYLAIGEVGAPADKEVARAAGREPAAIAAAVARLREKLSGDAPKHFVLAPISAPGLAMPAAAWSARSGDPVLFTATGKLPKATAAALREHPQAPVYVLGPSSAIDSTVVRAVEKIGNEAHRVSGEDPIANAVAFSRYADGSFGWNVNDPGHGFVLARDEDPLDAAAVAPLSASGTWGPLLLTDNAATLPGAVRDYFLDVKPGYTDDPTRAFYNHVWVIGDQEAIDVNQQAEASELAELAKIGAEGQ